MASGNDILISGAMPGSPGRVNHAYRKREAGVRQGSWRGQVRRLDTPNVYWHPWYLILHLYFDETYVASQLRIMLREFQACVEVSSALVGPQEGITKEYCRRGR